MALPYEPLDTDRHEIRILNIHPGPLESAVRCSMTKTYLIDPVEYAALSYCWGDAAQTKVISVDDIKTPVTVNLADALQRLRGLGVSRVWADALCINQADKQEKGLQIRNMKHIYSKADKTYSWLGREGDDPLEAVFAFFMSLLDTHDSTVLAPTPHTCRTTWQDHQVDGLVPPPPPIDGCQCCTTEACFDKLQRILERQYWKRRWIIQETSVSSRPILLCEDQAITLNDMEKAISRCRASHYWGSDSERVYQKWFRTTTALRILYQKGKRISLCAAIAQTRGFISTDPRDAIFSLLALCHDGLELVPTPNYFEPIEEVVTNLTRALILKYKHLDFILLNPLSDSDTLPSWAPDWLTAHLPPKAYELVDGTATRAISRFCLGHSIGQSISLGHGNFLRAWGVAICKITAMTSATDATEFSPPDPELFNKPAKLRKRKRPRDVVKPVLVSRALPPSYYSCLQDVLTALFSCLVASQRTLWGPPPSLEPFSHMKWFTFCLQCVPSRSKTYRLDPRDSDNEEESRSHSNRIFFQWLKANVMFPIQGKTLEELFQEQTCWYTPMMRALDSSLAIPYFLFMSCASCIPMILGVVVAKPGVSSMRLGLFFFTVVCSLIFVFLNYLFHKAYSHVELLSELIWHDWTHLVKPGKKLIVSDKGQLGMAPKRAENGDEIFYLAGCGESVVLRRVSSDQDRETGRARYMVIGQCYLHLSWEDQTKYLGPEDPSYSSNTSEGESYEHLYGHYAGAKQRWGQESLEKGLLVEIDLV